MDVVREIEKVETGSRGFHDDVPKDDVVIEKVEVQE
jgi:peptidyl-prolyl cis-trans isomerase B (cyclophilin B)